VTAGVMPGNSVDGSSCQLPGLHTQAHPSTGVVDLAGAGSDMQLQHPVSTTVLTCLSFHLSLSCMHLLPVTHDQAPTALHNPTRSCWPKDCRNNLTLSCSNTLPSRQRLLPVAAPRSLPAAWISGRPTEPGCPGHPLTAARHWMLAHPGWGARQVQSCRLRARMWLHMPPVAGPPVQHPAGGAPQLGSHYRSPPGGVPLAGPLPG
jgi:hypothetical protein